MFTCNGFTVGNTLGFEDGHSVGCELGVLDGFNDGFVLGGSVGLALGAEDGLLVGDSLCVNRNSFQTQITKTEKTHNTFARDVDRHFETATDRGM